MKDYLKKLTAKENLSFDEIHDIVSKIANREASEAQIAALLVGITLKGVDKDEFFAFAYSMREFAHRITTDKYIVDSCGTGADFSKTINISTAASIVANTCGANVIKQTNSSVTSTCGSSDFLEAMDIEITRTPEKALEKFKCGNITFVHSPYFNDFAAVNNPVRQQIGIKTIFNYLGPLINPSFPDAQLLGVSSNDMCDKMAYALLKLGTDRALVVNGLNPNLDEISLCSETRVLELKNKQIEEYTISPEDFDINRVPLKEIQGGNGKENAQIITEIFKCGQHNAMTDIIALNAGAMIYLAGIENSLKDGFKHARETLLSGNVYKKLTEIRTNAKLFGPV